MSKHALKARLKVGQRCIPKDPLLQLLTCLTGAARTMLVNTTQPSFLDKLTTQCQAIYVQNGRRAQHLQLPPRWEVHGIFSIVRTAPPVVKLQHRFSGATRVVPEALVSGHDLTKLYAAYLAVRDGVLNVIVGLLFSNDGVGALSVGASPALKRSRMGGLDSSSFATPPRHRRFLVRSAWASRSAPRHAGQRAMCERPCA